MRFPQPCTCRSTTLDAPSWTFLSLVTHCGLVCLAVTEHKVLRPTHSAAVTSLLLVAK